MCTSEKAGTTKASSKTGISIMRPSLSHRTSDFFSGTVSSMPQNHLACCLAGDPNRWRAAAGTMQDGLSSTWTLKCYTDAANPRRFASFGGTPCCYGARRVKHPHHVGGSHSGPNPANLFACLFEFFPFYVVHGMRSDL